MRILRELHAYSLASAKKKRARADKSAKKETNSLPDQGRPFTLCSHLISRVSLIRRQMINVDKELL